MAEIGARKPCPNSGDDFEKDINGTDSVLKQIEYRNLVERGTEETYQKKA